MAFRDLVGQAHARSILQKALATSRLAQAYLFHGPPSVGKKSTALAFTKALYCLSGANDACDTCLACRKIAAGNHPDVLLVSPDPTTVKIEQIRTLQHRLGYKPYEQQRTTVILEACETLTPPAANALLKTLEEPPANALLLLLTDNRAALPLTLVSRCQLVAFRPLAPADLQAILERQGMASDTATLAASLAEGRLDRCLEADVTQMLAMRQHAYEALRDALEGRSTSVFFRARQLAGKRDSCDELLRWLGLLLRDLTVLNVAPCAPLYNTDLRAELASLAASAALSSLLQAFTHVQQLRTYLSWNGNPQLIFEQALVELRQRFRDRPARQPLGTAG